MWKWLTASCCLLAFAAISCDTDVYQIDMRPNGDAMVREVTCWHQSDQSGETKVVGPSESQPTSQPAPKSPKISPLADDKLAIIEKAYGKPGEKADDKRKFVGEFKGKLPADLGGSGTYTVYASDMGSASIYLERLRGDDDLHSKFAQNDKVVDRFVEILAGYAKQTLGKEKGYDKLAEFLDKNVRKDLRNLAIYAYYFTAVQDDNAKSEAVARMAQIAIERGYASPEDLPALSQASSHSDYTGACKLLQRVVASKMGLDPKAPPEALAFLADPDKFNKSFDAYLKTLPEYQTLLAKWKKDQASQPATGPAATQPAQPPAGTAVFGVLLDQFNLDGAGPDTVAITLHLPGEPLKTNGQWKADKKEVSWNLRNSSPEEQKLPLPPIAYAMWTGANNDFQNAHFGKVIMTGQRLMDYCLWHKTLTAEQAAKWMKFMTGLKPEDAMGENLKKRAGLAFTEDDKYAEDGWRIIASAMDFAAQPETTTKP